MPTFTTAHLESLGYQLQPDGSYARPQPRNFTIKLPADHPRPAPKLEPTPRDEPLAAPQTQGRDRQRFLVRVTSVRKRLLDEDNLCEKYHVDLCRYAGIVPNDSPDKTKIEVSQRKAKKGEEERTVIEVEEI